MNEIVRPGSGHELDSVADLAADIVVRADTRGAVLYASSACGKLGYTPSELIGRPARDLVHPEDWPRFAVNTAQALSGGPIDPLVNREFRGLCKGGDWVWLEGNPQVTRDADGKPIEIVNVFRDVTERRRVREERAEEARFAQLAKAVAGVGYWRLDVASGKLVWSEQMYRIYGLDPAIEPSWALGLSMLHPQDRDDTVQGLDCIIESGHSWQSFEARVLRPDGELRFTESRGICEKDESGAVNLIFGTLIDITDRRRAEIAAATAEAERRAGMELFENAFRFAAIGMALVGLDGRLLKVNDAFCSLIGYPEAQMLNLDFQAITHPDDLNADLSLLADLHAGRIASYEMDKRYLRADGSIVWAHISVSMILDADGLPKHYIGQVQDLTARRKAEFDYRLMAENVTDMISTTWPDGRAEFVSPSCRTIAGYEPEDLIGHRPADLVHPDDLKRINRAFKEVAAGRGGGATRWRVKHKLEDRWVWVESRPSRFWPQGSDGGWMFLDVVRDVSAQVAQEEALDKALVAAEAASAAKSEFLANMSHEIRTPLTAILGFSALLSARPNLDDVARKHLQRVTTAGSALLALVNDVLDFSKLEAGQFEIAPRPVEPARFAHDTLVMFAPQADAKGLSLDFVIEGAMPDRLMFDPDRLRQILLNLIGNAIKFTAEGGVRLRVRYDGDRGRLHLAVEDTGPGLTRADQAKLFRRFAQVDGASTRKHGGTGLGLAICKGLAEAMGGKIGVTSTRGQGSNFHLYIDAPQTDALQADAAPATEEADAPLLDGVRVLVVDDNPMNRELARAVLEQVGAEVCEAVDGEDGLRLAAATSFDLILLDYRMPGIDGPETLRRLRAGTGPNASIPVLAFTADSEPASFMAANQFDDVIGKPINPIALITAVAKWVQWDGREGDLKQEVAVGG